MKGLRWLGRVFAALLLVLALAAGLALWTWRDIPAPVLEARYMTTASRFLNVDGVRLHYRDEGSGPPLVLIHANFASLLSWDEWVPVLATRYRVLRFDMPGHGLTGPDPSGNYSLERSVELTGRFADALGLRRFTIGGTSLGGTVAIHYAASRPERIERLVLLSPGALEGREMADRGRELPAAADILRYVTPRALAAHMLRSRFGDPERVTEDLIDRWYDMWLREGQREAILARLRSYSSADIEEATAAVTAPTLILWGEANPQAPVEQAEELRHMLANAPSVDLRTYPGIGHMAAEEGGAAIANDLLDWLDGRWPAEAPPAVAPRNSAAAAPVSP